MAQQLIDNRFADKVAFITGASNGIGRAVCQRLASEGATVIGADIDASGLAKLAADITESGGKFSGAQLDIGDRAACRSAIAACVSKHGHLDILGNVAGIAWGDHFADIPEDRYRQMMAVNVDGAFFLSQAAIADLIASNGSIINIASNAGLQGLAYLVPYTMSKGAIVSLTKSMAMEYVKTGVRINAIAPAGTTTSLTENFSMPADVDFDLAGRMLGFREPNEPEAVAALFAFIASDESPGIHGAILPIDSAVTTG